MTIKQAQLLLVYLGYDPGEIDGLPGPNTSWALDRFAADYGVAALDEQGRIGSLIGAVAGTIAKLAPEEKTDGKSGYAAEMYLREDVCYHIPRGVDVQLTDHFRACEIHCQGHGCCAESVISKAIMDLAEEIRLDLGEPLTIGTSGGSGYRCRRHNAEVPGAAANSLHCTGYAVDIHYRDPAKLKAVVLRHLKDGEVGIYSWGCHVGIWSRGYVNQFVGNS